MHETHPAGPRAGGRPGTIERIEGGLLGVVCGETWRAEWPVGVAPSDGLPAREPVPAGVSGVPASDALLDLSISYVAHDGSGVPLERAARYEPDALPAWLVATAIARPIDRRRISDTLESALTAGVSRESLGACLTYVELAAALVAGQPATVAIEEVRGGFRPRLPAEMPHLSGDVATDAVATSMWVLAHPTCGLAEIVPAVMARAGSAVAAAVGGLLGLRDGACSIPASWRRRAGGTARQCVELAPRLADVRMG